MSKIVGLISLVFFLMLSACKNTQPGIYETSEVGKVKKVTAGVIISKQPVKFQSKTAPGSDYVDGGQGYVYVIKLNNGSTVSIAQSEDLKLKVKQHVLVVYGKLTRVLPDDGSSN